MDQRHLSIDEHHAKTLEWMFDRESDARFVEWLEEEHGMYWVSGKAGSGKSTTMKYVAEHKATKDYLQCWAGDQQLVIASFFLWNPGQDNLQKSQSGLLRSILHQILVQVPGLTALVFPNLWNSLVSQKIGIETLDPSQDIFSVPYLVNAFRLMSSSLSKFNVRLCVLIDGLDEYEGKTSDIIQLVEIFTTSPHIKACVSSRPWNEFEKAFGDQSYKIYMHDMTRNDIRVFVRDTLEANEMFSDLGELEGEEQATAFIHELVETAEGVFLWVRLVTQSIRTGLTNADKFSDLLKRLRSLPTDLDEYFERILFGVEELYSEQAAIMCSITLQSSTVLPLMAYWFMDQDDPNYALNCRLCPMEPRKIALILRSTRLRLNAYCKGLLETRPYCHNAAESHSKAEEIFNESVYFLHRTVRDFLLAPHTQALLSDRLPPSFDPDVVICKAALAQLRIFPPDHSFCYGESNDPFARIIRALASHLRGLESVAFDRPTELAILKEFNKTICALPRSLWYEELDGQSVYKFETDSYPVLGICAAANLWHFIAYIVENERLPDQDQAKLLRTCLGLFTEIGYTKQSVLRAIVDGLLHNGADPNLTAGNMTPWTAFLVVAKHKLGSYDRHEIFSLAKTLIQHGADVNATVSLRGTSITAMGLLRPWYSKKSIATLEQAVRASSQPNQEHST